MTNYAAMVAAVVLMMAAAIAVVEMNGRSQQAEVRLQTPMIGGSMMYRREGPWPECIFRHMTGEDCAKFIKTGAEDVRDNVIIVEPGDVVDETFDETRVLVYVDEYGYCIEPIPGRG
mmetsp:Transcript_35793/g.73190  ORF Transcript_35793/g.73190 Transcript_35793/m.73190 type:complete len:117 (+) Transcript_35793:86-436(+)|eukprot:CAMPEP_0183297344 /NCGR_PEP_ID=MMETSP0160_2-20130417/4664_1 /TAXON_ID=2839 ORGANISM="Odontella Sinensis, Strain Grunow 1884" /NCGR_SAMPLE_ID=MMETSP0160_2 /ASSEMBLY_ACC=CAM_ASM_000250 /LENGTH=116 /DNA_ID=CAMNT_0025459149 /DNA_START=85 /DNA_END=435 /DNA_ORIENTATION=-